MHGESFEGKRQITWQPIAPGRLSLIALALAGLNCKASGGTLLLSRNSLMTETCLPARAVRFGDYEADLHTRELRKRGVKINLAGQPFEILAMLLQRPGELVTREEIRTKLWTPDTFVDFEHGLNSAIRKLREALCDSATSPRFVETLARRGYRFIGDVESIVAVSQLAEASGAALVGRVATLGDESRSSFLLLAADENALKEKQKLEVARDDLGISLLAASRKLLVVAKGTRVKILEAREPHFGCFVRILDGEHTGETALAPRQYLRDLC
jgi:DNA-binding winged helix-turn-helix (wHTH) protein